MNPIKLSHLLRQRPELLRQVRLANLAFAYQTLRDFATRVERARLRGRVTLQPVDADQERFCVTLTALDANQSLIEEHFSDEDLVLLADVLGYATGHPTHELTFHIDELDEFVSTLRHDLERGGVHVDDTAPSVEKPSQP
jgi:hypothetical protein